MYPLNRPTIYLNSAQRAELAERVEFFNELVLTCRRLSPPPKEYNCPRWIKDGVIIYEPKINVITSTRFLKNYPANDEITQMAKDFWLSYKTCTYEESLITPEQFSQDPEFLTAAEKIRTATWQHHLLVRAEDALSYMYHHCTSDPMIGMIDTEERKYYPSGENINMAGRDILEDIKAPKDFTSLKDYIAFKHMDSIDIEKKINLLPDLPGIKEAKRYWSLDISDGEAKTIKENFPREVEKIRTLLWKRHLSVQAREEFIQEIFRKQRIKDIASLSIGVTLITTAVFFYVYPASLRSLL